MNEMERIKILFVFSYKKPSQYNFEETSVRIIERKQLRSTSLFFSSANRVDLGKMLKYENIQTSTPFLNSVMGPDDCSSQELLIFFIRFLKGIRVCGKLLLGPMHILYLKNY